MTMGYFDVSGDALRIRKELATPQTAKLDAGVAFFAVIMIFTFVVTVLCQGYFAFETVKFYLR